MKDTITLRVVLSRRQLGGALTMALVLGSAYALHSESLTVSAYYPSPSGIYKKIISTADAILAREGGRVGIGISTPKGKLDIAGGVSIGTYAGTSAPPTNGLIISGPVGIGTATPASARDSRGVGLEVAGNLMTDDVYVKNPRSGAARWLSESGVGGDSGGTADNHYFTVGNLLIEGGRLCPGQWQSGHIDFARPFSQLISIHYQPIGMKANANVHDEYLTMIYAVGESSFSWVTVNQSCFSWIALGTQALDTVGRTQ